VRVDAGRSLPVAAVGGVLTRNVAVLSQPQALFRVAPVSRCSSSLAGHAEAVLSVAFSPNGMCMLVVALRCIYAGSSREGLLLTPRHAHAS
jgi:hypothetical protein